MTRPFALQALLLGTALAACTPAAQTTGGLRVIDDAGDTVRLARTAERVVSLSPATTELVFALGAGDRLAGRTRWCDYPKAAQQIPSVGDAFPPNVEAVLARRPDLVLLYQSPQNLAALARFREAGIPTLQLADNRLADVPRLARLLGPLIDRTVVAESLATAFDRELSDATASDTISAARPSLVLLPWDQPPMVIGAGSFQSELIVRAGFRNIFADLPVPSGTVSIEAIASRDPDYFLINDSVPPAFARRPEWHAVRAVREGRFLYLRNSAFGRPSPRAPEVLRELRALLPESQR